MIRLNHEENRIELSINNSKAFIYLNLGGSLQELSLQGKTIIANNSSTYKDTYSSSVLFPFAGRVENGAYTFNDKYHQLYCNDDKFNNALHGLIYDKKFTLIKQIEKENTTSVVILYEETKRIEGYPFLYKITLEYTLTNDTLNLKMSVKNTDNITFPFFLGWHPYFESTHIDNSILDIKSDKKITYNDKLSVVGIVENDIKFPLKIAENEFDNCFFLTSNLVKLTTPNYKISLKSDAEKAYLHIYTPPHRKSIALEPQTGISNNFNSKISLQTLAPKNEFSTNFTIIKDE